MVHKRIREYIKEWETKCYINGIPDETPLEISDKVPSYKRIAICLLKNDLHLTGLGFEGFNSKYYSILKRIEISARKTNKQLKLF
jgi:predicted phosphoadenosine phosphosulfate sulfurtransferase